MTGLKSVPKMMSRNHPAVYPSQLQPRQLLQPAADAHPFAPQFMQQRQTQDIPPTRQDLRQDSRQTYAPRRTESPRQMPPLQAGPSRQVPMPQDGPPRLPPLRGDLSPRQDSAVTPRLASRTREGENSPLAIRARRRFAYASCSSAPRGETVSSGSMARPTLPTVKRPLP